MIQKISLILFLLMSVSLFSQEINLDKYQYIIVADKFDFLKSVDQYQTSSLTKFLLKKKGFKVFLSNEMPNEVINNRCLALFASVNDLSGMLRTKSTIEIKDCFNKLVYTSGLGSSKLKEYKKSYHESIRNAFETMEDFEYSYNPNLIDVKKEEVKVDIPVKKSSKVLITPAITSTIKGKENKLKEITTTLLYAQPKNNGFQLVNLKPEVVFVILKTNAKDVFVIKGKNGIMYKKGLNWVAEYYENDALITKKFEVKF